jgi:hypothetical protein
MEMERFHTKISRQRSVEKFIQQKVYISDKTKAANLMRQLPPRAEWLPPLQALPAKIGRKTVKIRVAGRRY